MSTTPEPKVFATHCSRVELEPGNYAWCACGYSADGTFCDGSHRGKGFVPKAFEVTEKATLPLCLCKHTKEPPYCDGSHKPLRDQAAS